MGASSAGNKLGAGNVLAWMSTRSHTQEDNANLSANSRKLAIDVGLRTPREIATIGKLDNMPSVLFQPLETIMVKKKPGKADTSIRAIKQTLTNSALINLIAEQNDIPRNTAI